MTPFLLIFCLWQTALVTADSVCATGCQTTVSNVEFSGISAAEDYYGALCRNVLQVKSTFMCMREYCPEDGLSEGWNSLNKACEEDGAVELLPWSIVDDVTVADVKLWPVLSYEDTQLGASFNTSVSIDERLFRIGYQTILRPDRLLGIVVFFGVLNNLFQYLTKSSLLRSKNMTKFHTLINRYLVVPPILKTNATKQFLRIPSTPRLQVFTISAYFIITIVLMCVEYHAFSENMYFTKKSTQLWRYIGDRAGALVINNLPVMWLFATRNNFLPWATGWDFATFNIFHRWIGSACAILIFLHGMAVCIYQYKVLGLTCMLKNKELGTEYFLPLWKDIDWYMGVAAACSIILTSIIASPFIRKSAYELFLMVHQAFAVVCLVGLSYHLPVDGPDYVNFIWPCVAVWSFDRLGRIIRLLIWNKPASYSSAEYNAEANVIQLKVRVRKVVSPRPGSYYYVYGWRSLKFWESHPFTLSGWNTVKTAEESHTEFYFLIGVQGGFTSRLRKQLLRHNSSEDDKTSNVRKTWLSVEGPYGSNFDPWKSASAVFIIGGAGITVATSFMQHLIDSVRCGKHVDLNIKKVKIIWAIKNPVFYHFVYERYISSWEETFTSTDIELSLDVYLTSSSKGDWEIEMPEKKNDQLLKNPKNIEAVVSPPSSSNYSDLAENSSSEDTSSRHSQETVKKTFLRGRPNIRAVVGNEIEIIHSSGGKQLALVGCGPETMAHDIRSSFAENVGNEHVAVDFHLAPFGW